MRSERFAVRRTHELDGGEIIQKYEPGVTNSTVIATLHKKTVKGPDTSDKISQERLDVDEVPSDVLEEMYSRMIDAVENFNPKDV